MDSDKAVTATFTQDCYNLVVTIVGSGSVAKAPDAECYIYDTVVTLTPTAAPGWTFAGWSEDLSGSSDPESITMDSDKAVTATFTQDDRITFFEVRGWNSNSGSCNGRPAETYNLTSPVPYPPDKNGPGYSWLFAHDHTPNVKYINFTARSNNSGTTISYSYRYKQEIDGAEDEDYCNWIFVETLTVDGNKEIQSVCMDAPSEPNASTYCSKFEIQITVNGSNPKTYIIHIY